MNTTWIVILALFLVPVVMAALTWKKPWFTARATIVRAQIVASLVFLVAYPIVGLLTWPSFSFSTLTMVSLVEILHKNALWHTAPILIAILFTALVCYLRRRATQNRDQEGQPTPKNNEGAAE